MLEAQVAAAALNETHSGRGQCSNSLLVEGTSKHTEKSWLRISPLATFQNGDIYDW